MTEERKLGETARITMSEQIRELQHELDRQRNLVLEANKQTEELTGSRERLQNEHDRLVREFSTLKGALEGAEERAAAYREELTRIRESLRRTELEKDVLVQEKADAVGNVSRIQTRVDELEQKLYKSNFLENQLKDKVAQLQVMIDTHERDNQHLTQQNAMAHSSELRLTEERASLRAERHQLRDELDKLYMERGNLNTELEHVREQASRLETAKSRLEAEASELSHERLALVEALNSAERQKAAMLDDLNAFKRDAERQSSLLSRLNEEKEVLSKQKAEMLMQLSTLELATRQQQEHIIRLKSEKETLESSLFEAQQSIDHLQNKQNSLDREIAELKLRRDSLQAELLRAHTNFQVELDKSQRNQKELGNQLNTELEDLRQALNQAEKRSKEAEDACLQAVQRADQAVAVMGRKQMLEAESISDREIELQRAAEEANRLTRALLTAQRERDEARLQAEQERQRALLRAADERAGLQQRVTLQQETITELQSALDRSQRENSVREEQERSALKKATEEVRNFRNQLEDSNTKHEKEARDLRIRIHELEAQREQLIQETNELRLKIRLAEEFRTGNRAELVESTSRIRAVEEAIDAAKRECVDLRQKTAELEREKMALDASNDELRRQLKTAEMERVELVRLTNVTRSQLQGTEMDRTTAEKRIADLQENVREVATSAAEARREASELRNQAKKLVFEKESLEQELNELRQHLKDSQSKEVLAKRENSSMKQRITELEGTKSSLQSELSSLERQLQDTEDALRSRERASTQVAEEWDRDYRRLDETKKNLEGKVEQSTLVISELRGSLAETQAHLLGLESELTDTMASKQEAEARLSAIHSILRRLLGFRQSQYADALELLDKVDPFRSHPGADTSATDGLEDTGDDRSRRSGGPRSYELLEAAIRTRGQEDDADDEWELRRVAERIMNDRLAIDHVMSKSKLLQRTRHRFYKGTEMYPPAIMRVRSTLRSRRSKSSSPPRERMDAALVRPTSTERYPDPRDRSKNTCLEIMQSRTHPTAGELALVDQSPVRLHTWRSYLSSIRYRGLPGSDLDPEAVRMVLRDFLRHLVKMERERDTTEMRAKVHAEQVAQLKRELTEADQRVLQMQTSLSSIERGKLEVLDNLNTMRCTVSEQEVALHRMEKECEAIREKLAHAEQQLTLCETEKSQLQNRLEKMKSSEMKMDEERRQLLKSLDDAETRYTEAEVSRRRLEGDLKRSKATIAELEKEKESLQKRLNKTMRQNTELDSRIYTMQAGSDEVASALNQANEKLNDLRDQLDQERSEQATLKQQLKEIREELEQTKKRELSSEQERRILQERLEVSRNSLNETKAQLQEALERLQDLQAERSDGTLRRAELETQLRQLTNASADQQQTNEDLQTRLTTISCENTALTERNAELLRQVNNLGLEKHELQSESKRLAKELNQLKKTIDRIDRERSWEQEQSSKMLIENKEHLLTIRQLEEENLDLRRDVQKLQTIERMHMHMSNSITTSHNADILGGCSDNAFKELRPPFHLRHEFLGVPGQKFLVMHSHLLLHSGLHHLPNILDRIEERRVWA
ncbi:unnamed protein product [Dicrocoelium dendriticum]|nr:unnamed protein product [Dicrocoelium dendriticum]